MKKIVLLLTATVLNIISCQQRKTVDYAIVSGKIENNQGEFKILSPDDQSFSKPIKLLKDGTFKDTLRLYNGLYTLYDGRNRVDLYIKDGMDINIKADVKDFINTLSISGEGSETSSYYVEKSKIRNQYLGNGFDLNKLDEEEYRSLVNELKIAVEKVLDTFNGIPEDFKIKEQRNLHYTYLNFLVPYQFLHRHYAKNPNFEVSERFLRELNDVNYENDEDYSFSSSYRQIVNSHFTKKADSLSDSSSIPNEIAFIKVVGEIQNSKIKNDLLFGHSINGITYTTDLEEFYKSFMAVSTVDEHKVQITESYTRLRTLLKGNPSPEFVNYENYAGGKTSLNDFKGNYVYIDVWATWCAPCLREIPFLKEIEKKYRGKDIRFVSISLDTPSAYGRWKNMVADKDLSGVQLIADNNFDSEFIKEFLIKVIPRFILIDPNGDIVDSNAPKPSDPRLLELLNELNLTL